jgi:hypothetical protein
MYALGESIKAGSRGLKRSSKIYNRVNKKENKNYDFSQISDKDIQKLEKDLFKL